MKLDWQDYLMFTLLGVLILLLICAAVGVLIANKNYHNHNELAAAYCAQGYVEGSGKIDYCGGKPFVCDERKCYDVQKPVVGETCHKTCHISYPATIICTVKCEEQIQ